jgi:hypothetical protein
MTDEPAGYTINVDSNNIVIRHTGELTVRMLEGSHREAARLATATQLAGFLFDVSRAAPSLSTIEIFELCISHGSVLPSDAAVAVFFRPDQFCAEDVHLGETVSLNRGTELRSFTDLEAAEQWLSVRRRPVPG